MTLKRIKGSFSVVHEGRRLVFKAGNLVDEAHPAFTNSMRRRYLVDLVTDYPLPRGFRGTVEQATSEPGERREVTTEIRRRPKRAENTSASAE